MLTRQLLHRQWLLLQMSILYYDGRLLIQSDVFNSNSNTYNSRYLSCALLHTLSIRWVDSYPCAQSIPIAEYTHPFWAEFRKWRGGVYRECSVKREGSRGSPSASHTLSFFDYLWCMGEPAPQIPIPDEPIGDDYEPFTDDDFNEFWSICMWVLDGLDWLLSIFWQLFITFAPFVKRLTKKVFFKIRWNAGL